MTTLLEHRIQTLKLRLDAPFPSQIAHGHSTIRELQNPDGTTLTLVRCGCPLCNRDASDCANWHVFGESA